MHDVAPAAYSDGDTRDVNVNMGFGFINHKCDETNNSDVLSM